MSSCQAWGIINTITYHGNQPALLGQSPDCRQFFIGLEFGAHVIEMELGAEVFSR